MTYKNSKPLEGYFTVYMALTMAVMLSLCLVLIEGARSNAVRMEAEIVTDIALNSIMAEYHRELLNQYNLFYIDTSYGTAQPSYHNTEEHLKQYLSKNLTTSDIFLYQYLYRDFLAMEADSVEITRVMTATDYDGSVLRSRAAEAIKADIGIDYLEKIVGWLDTAEGYGLTERNIQKEKEQIDSHIQEYDGTEVQISENEWETVTVTNPTSDLEANRSIGILNLVIKDTQTISKKNVNTESLFGSRKKLDSINQGNYPVKDEKESLIQRLLFQEYLLRYLGYYGEVKKEGLLEYQIEYLIAGKDNDIDNLQSVVYRISALREVANVVYLLTDEVKCAEAEALAILLATAMAFPQISSLLKTTILLAWAYAESLYDVKVLLAGGKVPLIKTSESWHYDIACIFGSAQEAAVIGSEPGLSYTDYLRILLTASDQVTQTTRFIDIVEMDIRKTAGNGNFRMDGCIDRVESRISISSKYGYQYEITREKTYE